MFRLLPLDTVLQLTALRGNFLSLNLLIAFLALCLQNSPATLQRSFQYPIPRVKKAISFSFPKVFDKTFGGKAPKLQQV